MPVTRHRPTLQTKPTPMIIQHHTHGSDERHSARRGGPIARMVRRHEGPDVVKGPTARQPTAPAVEGTGGRRHGGRRRGGRTARRSDGAAVDAAASLQRGGSEATRRHGGPTARRSDGTAIRRHGGPTARRSTAQPPDIAVRRHGDRQRDGRRQLAARWTIADTSAARRPTAQAPA